MSDETVPRERPAIGNIASGNLIDRALRIFGDVRPGEGARALLMFLNVFLLLVAYYILKTVREPLILTTGGAELKSYAAGAQAVVLLVYVPLYGWLASRLSRDRLIAVVVTFFVACIELFFVMVRAHVPFVGFAFYVFLGIFSLTMIAQFWSFANDIYSKPEGDRLFPLIAIGSTAGAPLGAALAGKLFDQGAAPSVMMQMAAGLLLVHLFLYSRAFGLPSRELRKTAPSKSGGFSLVLGSSYLRLVAVLLMLLNIVSTTGDFILARLITSRATALADATPGFDRGAYIGATYGTYFFWVSVLSVTLQAFLVSRFVKRTGFTGTVLALPFVALGAYGVAAVGAGLATVRVVKMLENATDYSMMNTAKQMLWLPTSREQKFKAKQAIDTFFVRAGDMLAAAVVFVGTRRLSLSASGFSAVNVAFVATALFVAWSVAREYRRLTAA